MLEAPPLPNDAPPVPDAWLGSELQPRERSATKPKLKEPMTRVRMFMVKAFFKTTALALDDGLRAQAHNYWAFRASMPGATRADFQLVAYGHLLPAFCSPREY